MKHYLPKAGRGNLAMLNRDVPAAPFMSPTSCKDFIYDGVCSVLYPEYAALWNIKQFASSSPDIERPKFVVYTSTKNSEKNAEKFARFMNELESRIGIKDRTETVANVGGSTETSAPFLAISPKIWAKSPVLVSAYLVFLQLSPYMRLGESIDDFFVRQLDKKENSHEHAAYLRCANGSGNIVGLMNRSLPCMNREGHSDYLLSNHGRSFAWYKAEADANYPMTEEQLIALRIDGRKIELDRATSYQKLNSI